MPPKSAVKKAGSAATTGKRKTLSFADTTAKAAAAAVHTTHVNAPVKAAVAPAKKPTPKAAAAAAAKRKPSPKQQAAQKRTAAELKRSGIVKANRAAEAEAEEARQQQRADSEGESSDDEEEMLNGAAQGEGDADDLSDLADRSSSDDDKGDESKAAASSASRAGKGTVEPYLAVRLSFLPPEFQEPQLYKFLNQFGATVLNCFCVRSKRSHRSRGIAYVEFDKDSVIPIVVEECNGMALGGMSVRARAVTMRRPMPSRKLVTRRRALAYAYKTKGTPLKKHDMRRKDDVGLLVKAARTEKENNSYLKSLGIGFETTFFKAQLDALPAGLLKKKKRSGIKKPRKSVAAKKAKKAAAAAAAAAPAANSDAAQKKAAPAPKVSAKGRAPAPKKAAPKSPAPKAAAKKAAPPAVKKSPAPKTAAKKKKK